jgi:hypothetical protein
MVASVSERRKEMGKLKDRYLMKDTPPLDLSDLPENTFIKVTKFGSLEFFYFKEEGMWYQPGVREGKADSEVNMYSEEVDVLYMPKTVAIIDDFKPIGDCLSCGYSRCACDSFYEEWRER